MTTADRFDRFEREIPELMDTLAPTHRPDYFDDMLLATARTRQRPAWSALERWLPMGEIARSVPRAPMSWRPIALFVGLTLIVLAGLVAVVGSAPPVPLPLGPASNGLIAYSDAAGDIVAADPVSGTATTLIGGATEDTDPWFSNDGRRFLFERRTNGAPNRALFIADSDGSDVRELLAPAASIDGRGWSPQGDRFVLSRVTDPAGLVRIVDANDGKETTFDIDKRISAIAWRPNHDQLVVTVEAQGASIPTNEFYLVNSDGTGLRAIPSAAGAINEPVVSPDGSTLAYSTWTDGAEGRTHIVDIDSGTEADVDFAPDFLFTDLGPAISPDGTKLLVLRSDIDGYRPTVMPVDGRGPAVPMGAHHPDGSDGAKVAFSPDGSKVLASYQDDGTTWLYDVATGQGEQLDWAIPRGVAGSWQRLAP